MIMVCGECCLIISAALSPSTAVGNLWSTRATVGLNPPLTRVSTSSTEWAAPMTWCPSPLPKSAIPLVIDSKDIGLSSATSKSSFFMAWSILFIGLRIKWFCSEAEAINAGFTRARD